MALQEGPGKDAQPTSRRERRANQAKDIHSLKHPAASIEQVLLQFHLSAWHRHCKKHKKHRKVLVLTVWWVPAHSIQVGIAVVEEKLVGGALAFPL